MTNEKKAIDIALENVVEYHTIDDNGTEYLTHCFKECKKSALEMAEWKDKQFKKEKKRWIEKSAIWIMNHISDYFGCPPVYPRTMIDDYKKAMKEE